MSLLCPTPEDLIADREGRPWFLWDCELTLSGFCAKLRTGDRAQRAYLVGKLMRQAKPDDVFSFVSLAEIVDLWADLVGTLGRTRDFWEWLLGRWGAMPCPTRG